MRVTLFIRLCIWLCFFTFCKVNAQSKWSGVHGNEWLANQYGQRWFKIVVDSEGLQRVILPEGLKTKYDKLKLYRRGVEISLISATPDYIEFYAEKNLGESDALLYRPYTGHKENPYYSWYSDKSTYFLTYGEERTKQSNTLVSKLEDAVTEKFHLASKVLTFTESDTYDGSQNYQYHTLDQSYLIEGKGRSSKAIFKLIKEDGTFEGNPKLLVPIQIENIAETEDLSPSLTFQLNGRTFSRSLVKASIGKSSTNLRELNQSFNLDGFSILNQVIELKAQSDLNGDGSFVIQFEPSNNTSSYSSTSIFSVNFIEVKYPQLFNLGSAESKIYTFLPTNRNTSTFIVPDASDGTRAFDISDPRNPIIINGIREGKELKCTIQRAQGKNAAVIVTNGYQEIEEIEEVHFTELNPEDSDYLIISNDKLISSAQSYSNYRSSSIGGSHRSLVVSIKDIYNQFNYGEPSPVAIRRFVDYMVSAGIRKDHYLLLVGTSNTLWNRMKKELVDEVPTIGFPGSDLLLTEGLGGVPVDVPAIPVGRLSATENEQVYNYLKKVQKYEANTTTYWKKNVLHVSGGKSASEIQQLASILSNLENVVKSGPLGGHIKSFVKPSPIEVSDVNITPEVNSGVGMITYVGHGSSTVTDYDLGYVSDPNRGYLNSENSPLMYFNGCGVANIFNGRNNPNVSAVDRLPLSTDWILNETGSIAIIANTYYSFASTSARYLDRLYNKLFKSNDELSIGQIQKAIAEELVSNGFTEFDRANLHQSLLQGDPSLRLLKMDPLDYSVRKSTDIFLKSITPGKLIGEEEMINVGVIVYNNGANTSTQSFPIEISLLNNLGEITKVSHNAEAIAYSDTILVEIPTPNNISRVTISVDPENTLKEINRLNNKNDLLVNWGNAKEVGFYSGIDQTDEIAPLLSVKFNNNRIVNEKSFISFPLISVQLMDNSYLVIDSTLIDLYIKECWDSSCEFVKLGYSSNLLAISANEDGSLIVNYNAEGVRTGQYELLVNARDIHGNSIEMPYRVKFEVGQVNNKPSVLVYPNPFRGFVKFNFGDLNSKSIVIEFYNNSGQFIDRVTSNGSQSEIFWFPEDKTGLLIYKAKVTSLTGEITDFAGTIVSL
ncbi:peptidase C25-like protein [Dyadobacter jejuensis]|uniref:Peptidase C25-like protein n=1 Tax=Dyadobacter jejuensis TaxID=1082580 RepID=A0A316ASB4_9BACT|nr:C25 family cysteine peptidase [Dyadobacter jejuensis]PWJ60321.1 peptidase C25-like protein [Dyadobacter jejuensis]